MPILFIFITLLLTSCLDSFRLNSINNQEIIHYSLDLNSLKVIDHLNLIKEKEKAMFSQSPHVSDFFFFNNKVFISLNQIGILEYDPFTFALKKHNPIGARDNYKGIYLNRFFIYQGKLFMHFYTPLELSLPSYDSFLAYYDRETEEFILESIDFPKENSSSIAYEIFAENDDLSFSFKYLEQGAIKNYFYTYTKGKKFISLSEDAFYNIILKYKISNLNSVFLKILDQIKTDHSISQPLVVLVEEKEGKKYYFEEEYYSINSFDAIKIQSTEDHSTFFYKNFIYKYNKRESSLRKYTLPSLKEGLAYKNYIEAPSGFFASWQEEFDFHIGSAGFSYFPEALLPYKDL